MDTAKQVTVLIVEDERIVAEDIRQSLEDFGYEVVGIVGTGADAIKKAKELLPSICLMDICLKGPMDGIDAAKKIVEEAEVPIVFLTSYTDVETVYRVKSVGACGYLVKPFTGREILAGIETALVRARIEHELKEEKLWLSTVLSSIGNAIICVDASGCIKYLNTAAIGLCGVSQKLASGKNVDKLFPFVKLNNNKIPSPVSVIEELAGGKSSLLYIESESESESKMGSDYKIASNHKTTSGSLSEVKNEDYRGYDFACHLLRIAGRKPLGFVLVMREVSKSSDFGDGMPAITKSETFAKQTGIKENVQTNSFVNVPRGRVLVYDDDSEVLESVNTLLTSLHLETVGESNISDVVVAFTKAMEASTPFDCVLLDVPEHSRDSCLSVSRRIKELHPLVKVILLSGHVNDGLIEDYRNNGFFGALGKPFNLTDLKELMVQVFA